MIQSIKLDGAVVTTPILSVDTSAGVVEVCALDADGKPIIENGTPKVQRLYGVVIVELDPATTAQMMSMGA